jgi:ethanolamine utilization protein EutQ
LINKEEKMGKVVSIQDIEAVIASGSKSMDIPSGSVLTPLARDFANEKGIKLNCGCGCKGADAQCSHNESADASLDSDTIYKALKTLDSKGLLEDFVKDMNLDCECTAPSECPYSYESDPAGLKVVNGRSVKMEFLDTGNPKNKVYYQELISSSDSTVMNAGLLSIDSCEFDWEVGCDEFYYIIEGRLTIEVNGKVYSAKAGDAVSLPVGSKIRLGSKGKAKMYYSIKAA